MSSRPKLWNSSTKFGRVTTGIPLLKKRHHCVIIGAGLSGLAAAYKLVKEKGWTVEVLEARSAPGGRVFSHRFDEAKDLVCELGGEWIGEDHKVMQRLCGQLGLSLQRHSYSSFFWKNGKAGPVFAPGEWSLRKDLKPNFDAFADEFRFYTSRQQQELDRYDWWTTLRNRGFAQDDLEARDLMDSTDFGESIRNSSAFSAATEYFGGNATNEMDYKIIGGNDQLPKALAHSLGQGSAVHYKTEAKLVRQRENKVMVYVEGSEEPFVGEACICTVPARSLNSIEWDPELATEKSSAADRLQYARIVKTVVLYHDRFWPQPKVSGFSVFTSGVSDFCFDATYLQPHQDKDNRGPGILCSYAVGDKADDIAAESDYDLTRWITKDIFEATSATPVAADLVDQYVKYARIHRQVWQKDEYSQGSYAFYRPGEWFSLRSVLQEPHGSVLFAGEHLADWQGFMEGAVTTGEAAADAL
jgi:monoamine oxidase